MDDLPIDALNMLQKAIKKYDFSKDISKFQLIGKVESLNLKLQEIIDNAVGEYKFEVIGDIDILTQQYKCMILPYKQRIPTEQYVSTLEERIIDYIYETFDKHELREECGIRYAFDKIDEKMYEEAVKLLMDDDDDPDLADTVCELVDKERLYEALDDIANASLTFEEKLADVGMSIWDFL